MSALRLIRQIARSGDTERAWHLFADAGLMDVSSDDEVLTLKGRLLKDRALKADGPERSLLFVAAQAAYLDAAALRPATYPLINAATIALLDGRRANARALAAQTIALLDSGRHEPETPYWLGATRAEAELLLGRQDLAKAALADAILRAPAAWEDHASTLRHFRLILSALEFDAEWLDGHRPPASLHFSGIVRIGVGEDEAAIAIAKAIDEIAPGFAFGALAAGADILIAEAAVARGAELHVVLPASIDSFRRESVRPFGEHWEARFDRLLEVAAGVEVMDHLDRVSEAGVVIADEVAMGRAARQAQILESRAIALRVGAGANARAASRALDDAWVGQGLMLETVAMRRAENAPASSLPVFGRDAMVGLSVKCDAAALIAAGGQAVGVHAGQAVLRFDNPVVAARAALEAARAPRNDQAVIAIDYRAFDPDEADTDRLELVATMVAAAPSAAILVTRDTAFALALQAPDLPCETYGEIATSIGDVGLCRLNDTVAGAPR